MKEISMNMFQWLRKRDDRCPWKSSSNWYSSEWYDAPFPQRHLLEWSLTAHQWYYLSLCKGRVHGQIDHTEHQNDSLSSRHDIDQPSRQSYTSIIICCCRASLQDRVFRPSSLLFDIPNMNGWIYVRGTWRVEKEKERDGGLVWEEMLTGRMHTLHTKILRVSMFMMQRMLHWAVSKVAPTGAMGVSRMVVWSPDMCPWFSASAFLCGSLAGVSLPAIFASAISAALIVLSARWTKNLKEKFQCESSTLTCVWRTHCLL